MKKLKVFDCRTREGFDKADRYKFKLENEGHTPIVEMGLSGERCLIYIRETE